MELALFKGKTVIKTRIQERRQGNRIEMMPQYLKPVYNFLGNKVLSKKWVDLREGSLACDNDKNSIQVVRLVCEEYIDKFLIKEGHYEQIIHWYPEVQK